MIATPSSQAPAPSQGEAPLHGLKVVEFTHMVMGPSVGVILADLGAEVIKVEPLEGDATRRLMGSGAGYFPMYNRNKKSIRLDLKNPGGLEVAIALSGWADVFIENFRPGAMERLGLGHEALKAANPGLIYCSAKGFLPGPYETRTALDEVAQMMGGLAYMTGPPGRPLRAGASVIDVTGGMFGVIGILAALEQRHRTGLGQAVDCSLFETTAFLVGQHIAQKAVTGAAAQPMPVRVSAWAVYDVFDTAGGDQVFVGVVSDAQWKNFCRVFALDDWAADPALALNNQRVAARETIMPRRGQPAVRSYHSAGRVGGRPAPSRLGGPGGCDGPGWGGGPGSRPAPAHGRPSGRCLSGCARGRRAFPQYSRPHAGPGRRADRVPGA
jgi:crotonobetainyl-CoA:carnitine CoA-transferase CaiB-like acyl-CoA transferase